MELVISDNHLDVTMIFGAFDPWAYDVDGSCYIEFAEWVRAVNDWDAGLITEIQRLQVDELYQNNIQNPACVVPSYHLEIYIIGKGTVTPVSGDYDIGTTIPLTATPNSGAKFSHWSGDATGTDPTISILMDSDKEVTAHFEDAPPINYTGKREWCAYRLYHEFPGRQDSTWVVTEVEGEIGNLSVSLTKAGLAGVEATLQINTGGENISNGEYIALEVLGWWQYGRFLTGVTIYDYNYTPMHAYSKKIDIGAGEILHYRVYIILGVGALTKIWNSSDELIFEYLYTCDAKRIMTLQTELEYWRYYEQEGQFHFAGEVTLLTYNHYKQGGSWVYEGQVSD
jgi:hypothetical protein